MKIWWCMECDGEVKLGKHGQCEICGSEAVDLILPEDTLNHSGSELQRDPQSAPACA